MKKKFFELLISLILIPTIVSGKEVSMDWQKSFSGNDNDRFSSVIITENGEYVAVGTTKSTDLDEVSNKGLEDGMIVKYDKDGNIIWKKNFGGASVDYFEKVMLTDDGNYIVVGYSSSADIEGINNQGEIDAIIVKYDKDGNVIWKKNYGGNAEDKFNDVSIVSDGIVAIGSFSSNNIIDMTNRGSSDAIIVKFDNQGNVLWQKSYGALKLDEFTAVTVTKNDEFIAIGRTTSSYINGLSNKGADDAIIVKFDKSGEVLWQKNWGGSSSDFFEAISLAENDSFVVVGNSGSRENEGITINGANEGIVIKFDNQGNVLWQKSYGGSGIDYLNTVTLLKDNEIIVAGYTFSRNIDGITIGGSNEAIIVKYDSNGNHLWQSSWGGDGFDCFNAISSTKYGEILLVGETLSNNIGGLTNKGGFDSAIVKYSTKFNLEIVPATNGEATIEQIDNNVVISPKPNEGYRLDKILVKDIKGNEVAVSNQIDGSYIFPLYDDVSVEVLFIEDIVDVENIENPKTGLFNYIGLLLSMLVCSLISFWFIMRKGDKFEL